MPKTYYNSTEHRYENGYTKAPTEWKIKLSTELPDYSGCEWFINDEIAKAKAKGTGQCKEFHPDRLVKNGDKITLKVISTKETENVIITANDLLVVGMGDSYASGEGMPDLPIPNGGSIKAKWLEEECHRSLLSAQSLTAARLAKVNPHRSITFVTRACSGAEIHELHEKSQGKYKKQKAQFKDIKADLCLGELNSEKECTGEFRQPDLVLLSIGGNDGYFVPMIIKAVIGHANKRGTHKYDLKKGSEDLRDKGLDNVWNRFPKFANTLLNADTGFKHATIVHVGYPNPLMRDGENQKLCLEDLQLTDGGILGGVTKIFKRSMSQNEYIALRDDFVVPLTGSVSESSKDLIEWEAKGVNQFGLRQVDIAIACSVNGKEKNQIITPDDPKKLKDIALDPKCDPYWKNSVGFNKFPEGRWKFSLARNEDKTSSQNPGFVVNGFCLEKTTVEGRWFNVNRDTQKYLNTSSGIMHPNIYGQLYLSNRAWVAIPEEMRK